MKVAVLTSSRADYGIYLPLLKKLRDDDFFELSIIAFGTHLSEKFGSTVQQIEKDGFKVTHKLNTLPEGDQPGDISAAMGKTILLFSELWKKIKDNTDLVICLGDRYEMFAAVSASVPFNIKLAHLHGGETTLGAMDEKFRHAISMMSTYHFVSTDAYAEKVKQLKGNTEKIYSVGALGLDNLKTTELLSIEAFKKKHGVDMNLPTVLVTFHPETISFDKNAQYTEALISALDKLKEQIIVTMPNADTAGNLVREKLNQFISKNKARVFGFESLGTTGYFSCMSHCTFLLGNTSSGIIEAASFGKYVINLGDRQKGRLAGKNVIHCPITTEAIDKAIKSIKDLPKLEKKNIYGEGNTAEKIVNILKTFQD